MNLVELENNEPINVPDKLDLISSLPDIVPIYVPSIPVEVTGSKLIILMPAISQYIGGTDLIKPQSVLEDEQKNLQHLPVMILKVSNDIIKGDQFSIKPKPGNYIHLKSAGTPYQIKDKENSIYVIVAVVDYHQIELFREDNEEVHKDVIKTRLRSYESGYSRISKTNQKERLKYLEAIKPNIDLHMKGFAGNIPNKYLE